MKKLAISLIVLCVALVLTPPLAILGLCTTFVFRLAGYRNKSLKGYLADTFFAIAIAIDQLGNVVCKDLFNIFLIKDDTEPFGNPDETISFVMRKNWEKNNLRWAGIALAWLLNTLDKKHLSKTTS